MGCNISPLTDEQQEEIRIMFFGPYKAEWRVENDIVDNTDASIAERMNLEVGVVCNFTAKICRDHFKTIARLRKAI